MPGNYSKVKTVVTGEVITATDRNAEHENHITNATPAGLDDASTNLAAMQTTVDPYPAGAESLPTTLAGELHRLRYVLAQITGQTHWYQDPTIAITSLTSPLGYKRPGLTYNSATTVDVELNTGTANTTMILFPDGTSRTVTENTGSTTKYRRFDITAAAEFTSGTEDSGIRSGISEANNTWYAIYAVKSLINSANFVLAGDTTMPIIANVATLNSRYGTSGWVYLGMIRNGDNGGATGDILAFTQSGARTELRNSQTSMQAAGNAGPGIIFAGNASATSLTYTYAAGTGTTDIPNQIAFARYLCNRSSPATVRQFTVASSGGSVLWLRIDQDGIIFENVLMPASVGVNVASATTSVGLDIVFIGWIDGVLSAGINPLV